MNVSILVLSCDSYEDCWEPFFKYKNKYWTDCKYDTYLVTETKTCKHAKTININNECWTVRFKEALKQIDSPYVLIMLEDFFIRSKVNQDKIDTCFFDNDTITFNFEKDYRDSIKGTNWNLQYNNQIYLNSCQAGIWDRLKLIDRLQEDMNAWQWECTNINSPFKHYINNGDTIIDYGYTHDRKGFGVTRGKWSKECMEFLKDDNIDFDKRGVFDGEL